MNFASSVREPCS